MLMKPVFRISSCGFEYYAVEKYLIGYETLTTFLKSYREDNNGKNLDLGFIKITLLEETNLFQFLLI